VIWGKGKGKRESRKGEGWTGERVKQKRVVVCLFFISVEIVILDHFTRFLRVDPILCEFDWV